MALFSQRGWDEWIAAYADSHRHPVNRMCHTVGIPLIVVSIALAVVAIPVASLRPVAAVVFVVGWVFQFVGHAFERKPPEFLKDWRFLFVGLRWWVAKLRGRA
jgi:uncharacterized membrane protein YGL010W